VEAARQRHDQPFSVNYLAISGDLPRSDNSSDVPHEESMNAKLWEIHPVMKMEVIP
jgi:hypothetical protein